MNNAQLKHVWVEVANGRGKHGDFLKSFAESFIRADDENFTILRLAAVNLVLKYDLTKYLDNYEQAS